SPAIAQSAIGGCSSRQSGHSCCGARRSLAWGARCRSSGSCRTSAIELANTGETLMTPAELPEPDVLVVGAGNAAANAALAAHEAGARVAMIEAAPEEA